MSTTTASTAPGMQIIPGYECVERIGAGGYGEVWKVRAPGGLLKALKLVFGHFDEDRACRELKAVNAMKEVRHPFILSVERVEVVEGRLAIVTELADGSLKDRFDECRRAGQAGIEREELLNYLKDAAEALDFLCKTHALQHLDVKPENLLLVAGRVKVADFGMVKSVQDPSMSQLNSLTPVYAPPEAFDGQPGVFSDQYSLAIVYHEMLTGVLPFSGKTTAQLAAQHIYGRPILVRLPVADQPAIQRALSKEPKQRFPNCRSLIEVLCSAGSSTTEAPANIPTFESQIAAPRNTVARHTIPLAAANSIEPTTPERTTPRPRPEERPRLVELAPVNVPTNETWARPTLFIGIGGTGGKALCQLRRKLRERFGDRTTIQALQMLYIDSNPKSLFEASQRDELSSLDMNQMLAVPLQPSQDYREDSRELLGWLNRRWLYNIPRSLQTEGIRPLGRLAYVDHAAQVWGRIRSALTAICEPNGVTTSAAVTGLPFVNAAPRVFVVASSTGGTGSGIGLDIAFGLRRLMAELNLQDDQLTLILAHSTDRRGGNRDIALANTYSCLSELRHYCRFPFHDGLRTLGGNSAPSEPGLPNTYVVHLGDDLVDAQYAAATDSLADFLFRNSVTKAAGYFDVCRRESSNNAPTLEPAVRTFGIRTIGATPAIIASQAADELCRTFVDHWRGISDAHERFAPLASAATELLRETQKRSSNDEAQVHALVQAQADSWQISHTGIVEMVHGIVRRGVRDDVSRWVRDSVVRGVEANPTQTAAKLLEAPFNDLAVSVEPYLQRLTESLADCVTNWLNELMAEHESRVRGARVASEWFSEHLRNIRQRILSPLPQIETRLASLTPLLQVMTADKVRKLLTREVPPGTVPQPDSPEEQIASYLRLMTEGLLCRAGASIVAGILTAVRVCSDQYTDLRRDLAQLSESFMHDVHAKNTSHPSTWYDTQPDLARHLTHHLSSILVEIEKTIEQEFFGAQGELRRATKLDPEMRKRLPTALRSAARTVVNRMHKAQSGAQLVAARLGGNEDHPVKSAADSINSPWLHCGGGVRRLVVLPDSQRPAETINECEQAVGGSCTVLFDPEAQPAVCIEAADIPLRQILDDVCEGRNDITQVAERLHTRIDVEWSR